MRDNLVDVQYDLPLKHVGLLSGELGSLPTVTLDDDVEQAILTTGSLVRYVAGTSNGSRYISGASTDTIELPAVSAAIYKVP